MKTVHEPVKTKRAKLSPTGLHPAPAKAGSRPARSGGDAPSPGPRPGSEPADVRELSLELGARTHGDTYEAGVREDDLVGTSSSHLPRSPRQPEEPSEPREESEARLEGSL
jgi:hypothetical protein